MIARTVFLAAAVILGVGIGTAFAKADGSGINTYRPAPASAAAHYAMAGQAASGGAKQAPGWQDRNSSGGGG